MLKLAHSKIHLIALVTWILTAVSVFSGCMGTTGNPPSPLLNGPIPSPTIHPTEPTPTDPSPTPSPSPSPIAPADRISLEGPSVLSVGQCGPFKLSATNPDGVVVPVPKPIKVKLVSAGAGHFYKEAGCHGAPITEAELTGILPELPVSYKSTWNGSWELSANDTAPNPLSGVKRSIQITAGPMHALVIQGPTSIPVGVCSGPFSVAARDAFGNAATLPRPLNVRLTNSTVLLYSRPDCDFGSQIREVTLRNEGEAQPFYVLQATTGELVINAAAALARGEFRGRTESRCVDPAFGATPVPSDTFQLKDTERALGRSIATDSSGRVYVAGTAEQDFRKNSVIRRLGANGWETVDQYQVDGRYPAEAFAIARDPSGGMSITGGAADSTSAGSYRQFVRTSHAGSSLGNRNTWQTQQGSWNFLGQPTRPTVGTSLTFDAFGRPVIRGSSFESDGSRNFLVRWGSPDFINWGLAALFPHRTPGADHDDFTVLGGGSQNLAIDGFGHLWTTTTARGSNGTASWYVLKSIDRGLSWFSVDGGPAGFQLVEGFDAVPRSVAIDSFGRIYVAGRADEGPSQHRWVVRRSMDAGMSWETVDQFATRGPSEAAAVVADPFGGVYVTGRANDSREFRLVVRKSPGGARGTFETILNYQKNENFQAVGRALTHDSHGNLWVTGSARGASAGGIGDAWVTFVASCAR